jgi:hypothetical protein
MNEEFLSKHQNIIHAAIIANLIRKGYYHKDDLEDCYHDIVVYLIENKERIGEAPEQLDDGIYILTFVFEKLKILRNCKIEEWGNLGFPFKYSTQTIEKLYADWYKKNIESNDSDLHTLGEEYCILLHDIIYNKIDQPGKLVFILRARYGLIVNTDDLEAYVITENHLIQINSIVAELNNSKVNLTKGKINKLLTQIFNLLEGSNNEKDAIRKWAKERINLILVYLNMNHYPYFFAEIRFRLLFTYCFPPMKDSTQGVLLRIIKKISPKRKRRR